MTGDDEPTSGYDAAVRRDVPGERPADRATAAARRRSRATHHATATAVGASGGEGLDHGAVVIAAITSCTNTSNPSVMLGAGLLAKKAVEARPDAAGRG